LGLSVEENGLIKTSTQLFSQQKSAKISPDRLAFAHKMLYNSITAQ
jgi:hypothetical protein